MFDALEVSIEMLEKLAPIEARIRRRSSALAKQLESASESVALNLGEGRGRFDGDRRRHFEMAAGSAREVTVAIRIAVAKRYIAQVDVLELVALLDRLNAMLFRLTTRNN